MTDRDQGRGRGRDRDRVRIPADVERPDRLLANLTARQLAILATASLVLWAAYTATRHLVPIAVFGAVTFSLRTPTEQEALIAGFARFLNSLAEPIEILVRAEPVDLASSIDALLEAAPGPLRLGASAVPSTRPGHSGRRGLAAPTFPSPSRIPHRDPVDPVRKCPHRDMRKPMKRGNQ